MKITKERNVVSFEVEEGKVYRLNLATGEFYGLRGRPIARNPLGHASHRALSAMTEYQNLYRVIRGLFDQGMETYIYSRDRSLKLLSLAERLDAMGVPYLDLYNDDYAVITDFDMFVKYYRESVAEDKPLTRRWLREFDSYLVNNTAKKEAGKYADLFDEDMLRNISNNGNRHYTEEEWGVLAYYLIRGKMWEFTNGSSAKVREYIEMCQTMGIAMQKENNFPRLFVDTKRTYELKKREYDDKRMRESYAKHAKAFEFAYGDFVVVLPQGGQDIIDEGQNMHHCVGSYVDRVVEGRDYIIFVRHKDKPNECYLTCEVYTNGEIGQYYLAHDRRISSDEDWEFRHALAEHLLKNW
jgi:hypothetical protein